MRVLVGCEESQMKRDRSETYPGIANACATQWGDL